MQRADGRKVPLENAQIDVFRTDMRGEYHTQTNINGEFVVPGLPFIGTFIVAASHPTATPNWIAGVKAGRGGVVEITVSQGNGRRLTLDEINRGDETARKNQQIEEENKRITETNEIIARTFKAGNEALSAASIASRSGNSDLAIQKYTDAVAQYDAGLAADPEQAAILTNKAVALKGRGVERFNLTVRSKTLNDAARSIGLETAKNDFKSAAETSARAVAMLKAQPVPTDATDLARYNANKYAASLTRAESMRLFVTKVDQSQNAAGSVAFKEYIAIEQDPSKKAKAQLDLAQMLLDAGAAAQALSEFQTILKVNPDSVEANLGAGLAAYAVGGKRNLQTAANYLQRFVNVAPDTNPLKADANVILAELKDVDHITPQIVARPQQ
jgi:tetratricopeptide (TPR) repeat protein